MKESSSVIPNNAWQTSPTPSPHTMFNEDEPKEFAASLYQIWWRLPESVQMRISALLMQTCPKSLVADMMEYTDSYAVMQKICEANQNAIDKSVLKQIKAHVFSANLLSINQKRQQLLKFYCMYEARFTMQQKEMLAGIVGHMVPIQEQFLAPADRVITSAITNGADFDSFQLFIDFLHVTLKLNAGKLT